MKKYSTEEKEMINGLLDEFKNEHCECEGDHLTSFQDFKFNKRDLEQFKKDKGLMPTLKVEIGMWIITDDCKNPTPQLTKSIATDYYEAYDIYGKQEEGYLGFHKQKTGLREATNEEVETALIAEAKKRGFKEGVTINTGPIYGVGTDYVLKDKLFYTGGRVDSTFEYGACTIFKKGNWSTIIDEPQVKELTLSDIEKEFGCKVKIIK